MKRLRAAVIGVGYLGRFHAQKFAALPETELVAVVDADAQRAKAVAEELGVAAYTHHRDVLAEVDVVSIAAPSNQHFIITRDCLQAKRHVLVEKPVTETLAEADELIALARANQCVLQVGHLERFNPAIVALREIVKQPLFIETQRIALFKERGTEVNVILDLMIHDIDLILCLVKSDITAIRPSGFPVLTDAVDIAHVRLEFANHCVANVTASRVSRTPMRKMRVFQPDAYISIDHLENMFTVCRKDMTQIDAKGRSRILEEERRFEQADALLAEIKAFVSAVRNGTAPLVSGEDGKQALEVALAITQALEQQAAVILAHGAG